MFDPVPSKVDLPELEETVLAFWKDRDIFRKSVEGRPEGHAFVFYEGPPTANGRPGVHHVLARVFKDVVARYRTMRGYRVRRKAGWDTHGLPVELEVERELQLSSKADIERFGIERFNERCRESVFRYVRDWEQMTERIGFWLDLDDPYVTYSNDYIETGWWILRTLWDKGLIYEDYRVTPHCPRCDTSLSDHEVAQGYQEDTEDPSVYIKFRILRQAQDERGRDGAPAELRLDDGVPTYLLAWTTTPWTLPGNVALAVAADADYALVEREGESGGRERLVLARALVEAAVGTEARVLTTVRGDALVGLTYEPLFRPDAWGMEVRAFRDGRLSALRAGDPASGVRRVAGADFVSLEDGTGIVHIAPAFGAEDFDLGREHDLLFLQPIDSRGIFPPSSPFAGMFAKDADRHILDDLRERGLLLRAGTIRHTYPFCWRCGTPLLYYAKPSWYIRTTAVKDKLIAGNGRVNWYPEHIKEGRFGDWLANNVDWAVSRERYWGTPLPFWRCGECGEVTCIGSVAELRERAADHDAALALHDLHRPFVDAVAVRCACGSAARRVPEVADAWFDSGAMPYAQDHYPFEGAGTFGQRFPADFISEAIDQTRGWFYTLHAEATLLQHAGAVPDGIAYRNVICLGHILDAKGEKMSKSRGNVVEPMPVLAKHGADSLRWYLYTATPAGSPRRFSSDLVGEALRRFMLTLWNTYSFFVTYANIDGFDPRATAARVEGELAELDRWALSELATLVERVTASMEAYDPTDAGRAIQDFVDDLSNWYVRRSRRRFWKSEDDADKRAAYHTLYTCLVTLSKLLAPFTPFVAEAIYRNLALRAEPNAPESVHLADWPAADTGRIDERLARETRLVMRLASLGRAARARAGVKVRQPLARAIFGLRAPAELDGARRLASQLAEELNVKEVAFLGQPGAGTEADYLSYAIKPNLPVLGPKYGSDMGAVRAALAQADPAAVAVAVRSGQEVALDGYRLAPEEVLVEPKEREGFVAAQEGGYTAIVAAAVTPELAAEGRAREIVHRVQGMRRDAGFDIADRIALAYQADDEIAAVIERWAGYVRQETLAERIERGAGASGAHAEVHDIDGHRVELAVHRI